jgi:uncharacterized protein YybS (DUF2232 family)
MWWCSQLESFFRDFQEMSPVRNLGLSQSATKVWFDYFTLMATGVLSVLIILSNLMYLFFARAWQGLIKHTINLKNEFYLIRMNTIFTSSILVIVLASLIQDKIFMDILPVALFPFVFSGLSLCHALLAKKKHGHIYLFIFYCLLLALSPYMLLLLSLFGVVDSLVNFRKRFTLTFI